MKSDEILAEALKLPREDRAELARLLLESLPPRAAVAVAEEVPEADHEIPK